MPEEKHEMVVKKEEPEKTLSFKKEGEETPEKPVEEEPTETQEPPEEKETPPKPPKEEYTDREKQLFERAKKAEEVAKKAKEDLVKASKPVSDTDVILEVQQATKDLSPEEVTELQLRASANKSSLSDAREDENFKLWQEGHNAKVEKERALNPSTTQETVETEVPKSPEQRFKEVAEKYKGDNAKIQEENEKILNELTCKDPITGGDRKGLNPKNSVQYN